MNNPNDTIKRIRQQVYFSFEQFQKELLSAPTLGKELSNLFFEKRERNGK